MPPQRAEISFHEHAGGIPPSPRSCDRVPVLLEADLAIDSETQMLQLWVGNARSSRLATRSIAHHSSDSGSAYGVLGPVSHVELSE